MTESEDKPQVSPEPTQDQSSEPQPFVVTLPDDPASSGDWYLWAAVLALLTIVTFCQSLSGGFIWDDDRYIKQNPALQDVTGLTQIWKYPPGTVQYYPVTFTALWIEHHFWGGQDALGYRVVTLLLHALGAIALWRILRRLAVPGAWIAAALWAIHPLQTETVSWATEIKNTLSGLLVFSSVIFYLDWLGIREKEGAERLWKLPEHWQLYGISLSFFVLAVFAKTVVAPVAVVLLLVLWWKKKLNQEALLGLVPMVVIGALAGKLTSWMEVNKVGANGPEWNQDFVQRILIAGRAFWFYIAKLAIPIHLSFSYPRIIPSSAGWIFVLGAIALVAVLAALVGKIGRGPVVAVLSYLLLIFPSLGFVNVYPFRFSFVADHFQYLAGIPLVVLVVTIVGRLLTPGTKPVEEGANPSASVGVILSAAFLLLLGAVSWVRAGVLTSDASIWQDTLAKNPNSWLAASNLARVRQSDASASFEEASRDNAAGDADSAKSAASDAADSLNKSDQLSRQVIENPKTPGDVKYRAYDQLAENNITRLLELHPDRDALLSQAEGYLQRAMILAKEQEKYALDPTPYYTLGLVKFDQAQELEMKLRNAKAMGPELAVTHPTTRPNSPNEQKVEDAYLDAQDALVNAIHKSIQALNSPAVSIEGSHALPLAAFQRGKVDWKLAQLAATHNNVDREEKEDKEAIGDFGFSVQLNPKNVEAHYLLALCLDAIGHFPEAKSELLLILRDLDHNYAPAYNEIGRIILESGPHSMDEFQAAVESFKTALQLDPNMVGAQENLAHAQQMLASSRPSSRPTTMSLESAPATPSTAPSDLGLAPTR